MPAGRCALLWIPLTLLGVFAAVVVSVLVASKVRGHLGLAEDVATEEIHDTRQVGSATLVVGEFSDFVTVEPRPGQLQESLETFTFVEAQSNAPGPAMRAFGIRCPGRRALVQALDGDNLVVGDDRVRLELRSVGYDVDRAKRRVLLVHAALRLDDDAFVAEVGRLATGRERLPVLEAVLPACAEAPALKGLAALVRPTDPPPVRAAAALLNGHRDLALGLGHAPEIHPGFLLTLLGPQPAGLDPQHDALWGRVLAAEELPIVRAGLERLRGLPPEREVVALVAGLAGGLSRDAEALILRRLIRLDADVARPHLVAAVRAPHSPPAARLLAASLLHPLDADATEAALLAGVEGTDGEEAVALIGGLARFGGPAAMPALRALTEGRGPAADAAHAAMAEIRGRLAHLPTGGLALLRETAADGGLSPVDLEPEG